jgi:hypothetical protein
MSFMPRKRTAIVGSASHRDLASQALIEDVRRLIAEARRTVASTMNAALMMLYWRIGKRVVDETLRGERLLTVSRLSNRWHDN